MSVAQKVESHLPRPHRALLALRPCPLARPWCLGALCTHLLGDNVALCVGELFLCHLLSWNTLELVSLQSDKGTPITVAKWEPETAAREETTQLQSNTLHPPFQEGKCCSSQSLVVAGDRL